MSPSYIQIRSADDIGQIMHIGIRPACMKKCQSRLPIQFFFLSKICFPEHPYFRESGNRIPSVGIGRYLKLQYRYQIRSAKRLIGTSPTQVCIHDWNASPMTTPIGYPDIFMVILIGGHSSVKFIVYKNIEIYLNVTFWPCYLKTPDVRSSCTVGWTV